MTVGVTAELLLEELVIDPEFESVIPPLAQQEYDQLHKNILEDQEVYHPIIVWGHTIVDGHKRYKILKDNPQIPFRTRKVYYGMTEQEEAKLFSMQTGAGRKLTPADRIRAELYAQDIATMKFRDATLRTGVSFEHSGESNPCNLRCINTARAEYERVGEKTYTEALDIMVEAWKGCRSAFKADVLRAVVAFVNEYRGKYNRERLITRLKAEDPETIYRTIRSDFDTPVELRYVAPIVKIYNGNSTLNVLGSKK